MSDGNSISGLLIKPTSIDVLKDAPARIFGPVDSPERIAAIHNSDHLSPARQSPLRRSPRLSRSTGSSPVADVEPNGGEGEGEATPITQDEEKLGLSRPLTPDNEGFTQDEPTSVLASRIMRAHDNPSPPPQSPETLQHLNLPTLSLPFPLISSNEDPSDTSAPSSPPSTSVPELSSISATSSSNILETPTKSRLPNSIPDQSLSGDGPTFSPLTIPELDVSSTAAEDPAPTGPVDERAAADALVLRTDEVEIVGPNLATVAASIDVQDPYEELFHRPLRRSTRPRRSTARYISPVRAQNPKIDDPETDDPGPSNETREDGVSTIDTPRRRTITLAPNNASEPDPSPFIDQPRSRSPIRRSASKTQRELGSLSPSSSIILKSLLPPAASSLGEAPEAELSSTDLSFEPAFMPASPAPPMRFTTPIRENSPSKLQFQPADLDNPSRTPARRIPIQAAVASGQMSAQKAARLLFHGSATASTRPVFNIPSSDSPARRVLLHDSSSTSSPTKQLLRSPVRSRSVEPNPVQPVRLKKRSESVEPIPSQIQGKVVGRVYPFSRTHSAESVTTPLKTKWSLHPTIIEEGASTSGEKPQRQIVRTAPAPVERSRLKQPTSKIPRIGSKPYARPPASVSMDQDRTSAMRMVDSSKPQGSSMKLLTSNSTSSRPQALSFIPISSPAKQRVLVPSTPTSLKRKRGPEGLSPTKPTPVVLLPKRLAGPSSSPTKKHAVTQLRMVSDSDGVLPNRTNAGTSGLSTTEGTEGMRTTESSTLQANTTLARPVTTPLRMVSESDGILPNRSTDSSAPSAADEAETTLAPHPSLTQLPLPTPQPVVAPPSPSRDELIFLPTTSLNDSNPAEAEKSPPVETSEFTFRRTTRSGRNSSLTTKSGSSSRPPPARRRNVPTFTDNGPFSGMTALALRTLTDSNTTKNKEYVTVLLQTEVVRKEGSRPESPGMNVKSIVQKEKEAKTRERSARAERRAQRGDPESKEGATDDNGDSEDEDYENGWDSSPSNRKHTWGPGDEEDYETPVRPMKRLRLGEDVSEEYDQKRVKWDRGLYTEIYLDEIEPRTTHARITQENIQKGCLAPTAKALRLDTLGNLPNAGSPLKDITPENIVVKKFIYDNDVVEPVAPTPALVKTRSKSKKSKT